MDFEITLKARVDFSTIDPGVRGNAQLDANEALTMVYYFENPTNQNGPGIHPGVYVPTKAKVSTNNNTFADEVNVAGAPSGSCYANDNTFGSYDHLGFHFDLRNATNSPFGDLDSIQLELRSDTDALSGLDLPTDPDPMMKNHNYTYLFMHNLRQPAGAGLDLYFGNVIDAVLDIETN